MAVKNKYILKQEKGVLHIGGGRFFYPDEIYDLTEEERQLYGHYFNEEQVTVLEEDEELGEKTSDDGKTEDVVNNETATANTENIVDNVKVEKEAEAVQSRRKPSAEKPEK